MRKRSEPSASDLTKLIYEKGSAILATKDRFRLTLRDRDSDFFQSYIQKEDGVTKLLKLNGELTDSQHNIRANATLYTNSLAKIPEADRLRLAQFAVTRCYLVVVATPDLDSAYRIFSVLNSRGLDLAATDILKSEIIGGIPAVQRESYTKKWEDAEVDLGREPFTDLFSHIRMVYRRLKPKGTLIKEFKDHVTEAKQPAQFIDQVLIPIAKALYEEVLNGAYESTANAETVNEHLKWLNRLEFNDWVPPALAFTTRNRQDSAAMAAFFRDLERLAYALLIQKVRYQRPHRAILTTNKHHYQGGNLYEDKSPLQLTPGEQLPRMCTQLRRNGLRHLRRLEQEAICISCDSKSSSAAPSQNMITRPSYVGACAPPEPTDRKQVAHMVPRRERPVRMGPQARQPCVAHAQEKQFRFKL